MSIPKARRQGILRALPFILAAMRIVHRVHSGRDVARITELAGNISRMPPALTYRADCKYDRGRLAAIPDVCHREHQVLSTLTELPSRFCDVIFKCYIERYIVKI